MTFLGNIFAFLIVTLFIVFFLKHGLSMMGIKTAHLQIKWQGCLTPLVLLVQSSWRYTR